MVHRSRHGASDGSLVTATLLGDNGAFAELVSRYQRLVYGVAYAYLLDDASSEDVARQVFLNAFATLSHLQDTQRFRAWLSNIAQNNARIAALRQYVERRIFTPTEAGLSGIARSMPELDGLKDLPEAFLRLSEVHRVTAALYLMGGYTQEEVAAFLSIPAGTVSSRLHEVRETLPGALCDVLEASLRDKILRFEFTASVMSDIAHLWRHSFQGEEEEEAANYSSLAQYLTSHPAGNTADQEGLFLEFFEGRLAGFGLVTGEIHPRLWTSTTEHVCNLTSFYVAPRYRRRGIGSRILTRVEKMLRNQDCSILYVRPLNIQLEPLRIRWGEKRPAETGYATTSQGVDVSSPAYPFFLNRGYRPSGLRLFLSWNIERHGIPEPVDGFRAKLESCGISFKTASSRDLEALFNCMDGGDPGIGLRQGQDFDPASIQIVKEGALVVGYAGPSYIHEDGRAESLFLYVRPEYRRRKIATVLTHLACGRLSNLGGVEYRCIAEPARNSGVIEFLMSKDMSFTVHSVFDPRLKKSLKTTVHATGT